MISPHCYFWKFVSGPSDGFTNIIWLRNQHVCYCTVMDGFKSNLHCISTIGAFFITLSKKCWINFRLFNWNYHCCRNITLHIAHFTFTLKKKGTFLLLYISMSHISVFHWNCSSSIEISTRVFLFIIICKKSSPQKNKSNTKW